MKKSKNHRSAGSLSMLAVLFLHLFPEAVAQELATVRYSHPNGYFDIYVPDQWAIDEYPNDPRGKAKFSAPGINGVSILVIGMATEMQTIDEVVESSKRASDNLRNKYRQFSPSSTYEIVQWDGKPAVRGNFRIPGQYRQYSLEFLRGSRYYMLSYAAPEGVYEKYSTVAMQSMESLEPIPMNATTLDAREQLAASKLRIAELDLKLGRRDLALQSIEEGLTLDPKNKNLLKLKESITK